MQDRFNELEQLLNEVPVRIQKKESHKCPCGNTYSKSIDYELKIEVSRTYNEKGIGSNNYRVYYYRGVGQGIIGTLHPHRTLFKAVKHLKERYLTKELLEVENG